MHDGWETVATFATRVEAELARARLEQEGIDALVDIDDVGGAYPSMQSVTTRLLVASNDAPRAIEILGVTPGEFGEMRIVDDGDARLAAAERQVAGRSEVRSGIFGAPAEVAFGMLLFGLFLGFVFARAGLFTSSFVLEWAGEAYVSDLNADEIPDEWVHYFGPEPARLLQDRNFDGKVDLWMEYVDGRVKRAEQDDDFDGAIDGWADYIPSGISEYRWDSDGNGIPDATTTYRDTIAVREVWAPNGGAVERETRFLDDNTIEDIFFDADGNVRLTRRYDALGRETTEVD